MNKKLQTEIREFIGDDPAKAVERVRYFEGKYAAQVLLRDAISLRMSTRARRVVNPAPMSGAQWVTNEVRRWEEVYGLAAYGAGLAAVLELQVTQPDGTPTDFNHVGMALVATADAETCIAAMLWAAAWIIEPEDEA